MAAKKYYFGVGGGTRQFLSMIEKDGKMVYSMMYIKQQLHCSFSTMII